MGKNQGNVTSFSAGSAFPNWNLYKWIVESWHNSKRVNIWKVLAERYAVEGKIGLCCVYECGCFGHEINKINLIAHCVYLIRLIYYKNFTSSYLNFSWNYTFRYGTLIGKIRHLGVSVLMRHFLIYIYAIQIKNDRETLFKVDVSLLEVDCTDTLGSTFFFLEQHCVAPLTTLQFT